MDIPLEEAYYTVKQAAVNARKGDGKEKYEEDEIEELQKEEEQKISRGALMRQPTCSLVRRALVRVPNKDMMNRNKEPKRLAKGPFKLSPGVLGAPKKNVTRVPPIQHTHAPSKGKRAEQVQEPRRDEPLPPDYPFKSTPQGKPEAYIRFIITRFSGLRTVYPAENEVEQFQKILLLFTYDELRRELASEFRETIGKILPHYRGEYRLSDGYQRRVSRTLEFLEYLTRNKKAEFVVVPAVPVIYVHLLNIPE